jgi:hypothetical protein
VRQLEGVVDLVQRHAVGDQIVDIDFPRRYVGKYLEVDCARA